MYKCTFSAEDIKLYYIRLRLFTLQFTLVPSTMNNSHLGVWRPKEFVETGLAISSMK